MNLFEAFLSQSFNPGGFEELYQSQQHWVQTKVTFDNFFKQMTFQSTALSSFVHVIIFQRTRILRLLRPSHIENSQPQL